MTCIKTGAHVWLNCYHEYLYGDAFQFDRIAVFRIVRRSFQPLFPVLHFRVGVYEEWFDKGRENVTSTLIARDFIYLGFEGVPEEGRPDAAA